MDIFITYIKYEKPKSIGPIGGPSIIWALVNLGGKIKQIMLLSIELMSLGGLTPQTKSAMAHGVWLGLWHIHEGPHPQQYKWDVLLKHKKRKPFASGIPIGCWLPCPVLWLKSS